jgi:hypothetical protein
MRNTETKKKEGENLIKEAEELYEELTTLGIEDLEKYGNVSSAIYVLDAEKIVMGFSIGPDKDKLEALIKDIFKIRKVLALITIGKGWAVKDIEDRLTLPLKHHPGSYEAFVVTLESKEIRKTKEWKIKRDEKGRIIFPLGEPEVSSSDFISKYTGSYFNGSPKGNKEDGK